MVDVGKHNVSLFIAIKLYTCQFNSFSDIRLSCDTLYKKKKTNQLKGFPISSLSLSISETSLA